MFGGVNEESFHERFCLFFEQCYPGLDFKFFHRLQHNFLIHEVPAKEPSHRMLHEIEKSAHTPLLTSDQVPLEIVMTAGFAVDAEGKE